MGETLASAGVTTQAMPRSSALRFSPLGLWVAPFAVERCRLASPVRRFQPGDELRG